MKRIITLVVLLAMLAFVLPMAAAAAEETITPYAYSCATLQSSSLSMGGETYDDAIMFSMGYTGSSATGNKGEVTYNFKGQYKTLAFDVCYVKGENRNATFSVAADGVKVLDTVAVSYTAIPKRYTIDLEGVHKLTITFNSSGYDKTYYAMGNIVATPVSEVPSNNPLASAKNYDNNRYLTHRTNVVTDVFTMGGYRYENGYNMKAGYDGTSTGKAPKLGFNFKGQYKELTFDIARYMSDLHADDLRSAYLTIEIDGEPHKDYNSRKISWNDPSLHIELDLTGVSQVVITVLSDGYDTLHYRIGNVQTIHDHDIETIPGKAPTCTEDGVTDSQRCTICNEVLMEQDTIPATGHKWSDAICTEPKTCTVCQETEGKANGHSWVDATCTAPKTCTVCQETEGEAISHTFDQKKVDPQYLVSEGVYYKSCKCGAAGEVTFTVVEEKPFEFKDVPKNAYYYDPVMWAVQNKITSGTGDGTTFEPNAVCTRGQVVTFLWRAAGKPEPKNAENPFVDVKPTDFFYNAVLWARENNITSGTGDGTTFEPHANCNRAQIVTFLFRAKKGQTNEQYNPFFDVPADAYYNKAVLWAVENKITTGTGDGTTFEPNAGCTRGQVITFLYRAYTK